MDYVMEFLQSTLFKRFLWNTLAAFLGLLVIFLGGLDWIYAPIIIGAINGILKELNK